jgi:hypothetical protein
VPDLGPFRERAMACEQWRQDFLVTMQQESRLGMPPPRNGRAGDNGRRAAVSTHCVDG